MVDPKQDVSDGQTLGRAVLRLAVLAGAAWIATIGMPIDRSGIALLAALVVVAVAPAVIRGLEIQVPRLAWGISAIDAVVVALCLMRGVPGQPELLGAYFVALLVAVLASGSPGWPIAGLAASSLYLALHLGSGVTLEPQAGLHAGFLGLASFHFLIATRRADEVADRFLRARAERGELWTLLEITDAVTSTLDLHEVMSTIVRRVSRLVGAESCSIVLADNGLRNCFVLAASERPEVDMLEVDLAKYPELRRAIETREPVVVDDVGNDPLVASVRDVLLEKGYRSMLVLPLLFGREVLGTLFLRASRDRPFSEEELRFCKVAAGASANALKNAMLFRQVQQEAEGHRETGEKLRRVLDCSPDLIVATDNDGRVTEMNGPASRLPRSSEDECEGSIDLLFQTPGLAEEASQGVDRREVRIDTGVAGPREIHLVNAPMVVADGAPVGRVWVGRDVTDIRRAERGLAQVERLSTLGEIVAGVAHELNNPLSAVLGYSELLRRDVDDESQLADLERVVAGARRCKRIVQNLLGFARKHQPERKQADLNASVRKVVELRAYSQRSHGIETILDLNLDLPTTLFDPYQIEQVVMNLVTNAEQAIREDSTRGQGRITVRTYRSEGGLHVEVEDDGPGIPRDAFPRIFDPFFTTKEIGNGTGLGLSVSFGIVQEHDGHLEARPPVPGRGACFVMRIPCVEGVAADCKEAAGAVANGDTALRGRKILIAEDEPLVRDFLTRLLGLEGAEVVEACDGEEAWEKLAHADFDLVIADLRMPRMDGQELYERIAEERPELLRRLVFSSGDLAREETVTFLRGLPNRLLAKPLQVETVRHVLRRALEPFAL